MQAKAAATRGDGVIMTQKCSVGEYNKKLSYRRETARQLSTWREGGARPSSPLPSAPSGYTYAYG